SRFRKCIVCWLLPSTTTATSSLLLRLKPRAALLTWIPSVTLTRPARWTRPLRIWAWAHLKHVPATVAANPARYRYCPGPVTALMACSRHGVRKKANHHGYFRQAHAPAWCRKIHELFPASSLTPTSPSPRHFGRLRHTRWH